MLTHLPQTKASVSHFVDCRYASLFVAVVAFDLVPGLGSSFGMVPIPPNLRIQLLVLAPAAFVVTWNWER